MRIPGVCSHCGGLADPANSCQACGAIVCPSCFDAGLQMCRTCAAKLKKIKQPVPRWRNG